MKKYSIAIVGCTGKVGQKMLEVLAERKLPAHEFVMFASKNSAGEQLEFLGQQYTVVELNEQNILKHKVDIALMSAGGTTSKIFSPIFAKNGTLVIDNSSQWRMDENVPLVVPEANSQDIFKHNGIIANPNCSTIPVVVALKPLDDKYTLKRVAYTTYQAVSGAGVAGNLDLSNGAKGIAPQKFQHQIFDNLIPHIDVFLDNGYTKEEEKMIQETRKILHKPNLRVTATAVRAPISNCHSESVHVEFEKPFDIAELVQLLKDTQGIVVVDDPKNNVYPMPITANNKDEVFVGRIRRDFSVESGINMWIVSDNIRKGAATNTVQIAEAYIAENNKKT